MIIKFLFWCCRMQKFSLCCMMKITISLVTAQPAATLPSANQSSTNQPATAQPAPALPMVMPKYLLYPMVVQTLSRDVKGCPLLPQQLRKSRLSPTTYLTDLFSTQFSKSFPLFVVGQPPLKIVENRQLIASVNLASYEK